MNGTPTHSIQRSAEEEFLPVRLHGVGVVLPDLEVQQGRAVAPHRAGRQRAPVLVEPAVVARRAAALGLVLEVPPQQQEDDDGEEREDDHHAHDDHGEHDVGEPGRGQRGHDHALLRVSLVGVAAMNAAPAVVGRGGPRLTRGGRQSVEGIAGFQG